MSLSGPPLVKNFKMKICLVGEESVGKTSLIKRYVKGVFREEYIRTIGTLVSKKEITLRLPQNILVKAEMMVWDIMGKRGFMELLKQAYFKHAQGVLAVCDTTRPETFNALRDWIQSVHRAVGDIPILILANKVDLVDKVKVGDKELEASSEEFKAHYKKTSAKTGQNVQEAFEELAKRMIIGKIKIIAT